MTAEAAATAAARRRLDGLWRRGLDFLGCDVAILGGAMSWVSERNLVAAISNAGGFGVIACGSLSPAELDAEIAATRQLTARPFGVNLITMHPALDALIDVCVGGNVTHIALAGALPRGRAIARIKDAGIKVIAFAPTVALAKRLVRSGVDALVIEGMEAGGHIGPVSTNVLVQEMLPAITDVPVFVAGGIGRGEAILMFLEAGAAGVQMGTRFVCATESIAHANFKRAFVRANARDAVLSVQVDERFPVIPVRALANEATKRFRETQHDVIARHNAGELTMPEAQLEIEHFWAGALRRAAIDGDVVDGSIMAGQSVGLVKTEQPIAEILVELVDQSVAALLARGGELSGGAPLVGEGAEATAV